MANEDNQTSIKALLVFKEDEFKKIARATLESNYPTQLKLTELSLLQEAIELLETGAASNDRAFDMIVFEHHTPSLSLVKMFLELGRGASFVLCSNTDSFFTAFQTYKIQPSCILSSEFPSAFYKEIKKLSAIGKIPPLPVLPEGEYVAMKPDILLAVNPLKYDIYVKLGLGRHVRLFKKDDHLEQADLDKYQNKQGVDLFYVKKVDCDDSLMALAAQAEQQAAKADVTPAEASKNFNQSQQVVRDVISQIGFSPAAQAIAKSSVAMTLKAVGSKPRLSAILRELKKKDGNYIASHSFLLGQVACAMAHKVGWSSATTFFKLSLASFLHDISLNNAELAQTKTLEEAKMNSKFKEEDIHLLKLHPVKAAEYSKQFSEIPSDVDQIIVQHHEQGDGSGYPRGLSAKYITPLSAIFIMAHDMVHYIMDHPDVPAETFYEKNASKYQAGQFKKIFAALITPDAP